MTNEFVVGAISKIPSTNNPLSSFEIITDTIKEYSYVDLLCFGELYLLNDPQILDSKENEVLEMISGIRELSKKYNVAVSYGCVLKDDGKNYISQRIAFPNSREYIYKKVHLGKNEMEYFYPGDTIDVFDYKGYTFGVQICIDTHIMEMSILQKKLGAQIIIAPFNTPYNTQKRLDNWSKYIPTRAYECNMCYICSNYHGGIQIVNGYGNIVKESISVDSIVTYTISSEKDFNKKLDYFSYRRPVLYENITK